MESFDRYEQSVATLLAREESVRPVNLEELPEWERMDCPLSLAELFLDQDETDGYLGLGFV